MAKHHPRRQEQIQTGRQRATDAGISEPAPAGAEPLTGAEPVPAESGNIGNYWYVILVWAVGFLTLIAFELVAAISRR